MSPALTIPVAMKCGGNGRANLSSRSITAIDEPFSGVQQALEDRYKRSETTPARRLAA